MEGMAAIKVEVLMFVCGLSMDWGMAVGLKKVKFDIKEGGLVSIEGPDEF